MSSEDLLYFDGVNVSKDSMTGVITSEQLIEKFSPRWIPYYQRGRVMNSGKIKSLVDIFKNYGKRKIDSIKLNLEGEYTVDKKRGEALLEGKISIIDGQQRLWALQESKVKDIKLPVELYINLPIEEQVKLFHQFNKDGTKLSFGELAKSTPGPFADAIRSLLKRKGLTAIPLSVNPSRNTMGLNLFCPVVYHTHRRIYRDVQLTSWRGGKALLKFLETPYDQVEVNMSVFGAKMILQESVNVFGNYDSHATAYKRSFFNAWGCVVANNFMTTHGKVDFGKFTSKIKQIPDRVIQNAHVKEIVARGGEGAIEILYNEIIEHLNHKLRDGHLPRTDEIEQSAKAMKFIHGMRRAPPQEDQPSA